MAHSPSATWSVLIVEDDAATAALHERIVGSLPAFHVRGKVVNGDHALQEVRRSPIDLILLDLTLAGSSGLTLLHRLRTERHLTEVIAVTAACHTPMVRAVIQRGAIDYLVKPFPPERLLKALTLFTYRMKALMAAEIDQDAVDVICSSGRRARRLLPKGLTPGNLAAIHRRLRESTIPLAANDVARDVGVGRVTARRYLEYLAATEAVQVGTFPDGPGRPRKLYSAAPDVALAPY